jgi:LPS export ABC transporter permease LptG/LPS export ABC transporter permease LptF
VLDRYIIRETVIPFLLALAVYTFVLAVDPMLQKAQMLLAKGVPLQTVGFLLLTLLPQALGITIPMAFLTGLLMALGRMSGDRESVALLACGVSPARLIRPVLILGCLVGGLDLYVMVRAVPDGNLAFVEATWKLLTQQSESDIKPRVFFERFPGLVLYVNDPRPGGGWQGVLVAETARPGEQMVAPTMTLAETGNLVIDNEQRLVRLVLTQATRYSPGESGSRVYSTSRQDSISLSVSPESVFGAPQLGRGLPEMRISDLRAEIARKRAIGETPHNELLYLHQKFSFPVACLVFSLLGLALGMNTRKEGKLAGLTLGLAVIVVYWALMGGAEAWTKAGNWEGRRGGLPAEWSRWVPNIVLGIVGILAVWWRTRATAGTLLVRLPEWLNIRRRPTAPPAATADGKPAPPPPRFVVVIRFPRIAVPLPRLLDRYVGARYLRSIALIFIGLLILLYVGTFVDLSQKLFKGQATFWMFLQYLWYSTPQFIAYVIPSATLVAVLGTIGALMRSGELTVMRACGVSLYRTALPLMFLAVVWSGLLFLLQENVLASASRQAEELGDAIRGRAPHTHDLGNLNWLADVNTGRIYYYAAFDSPRARLFGLSVFETARSPYRLTSQTYAASATSRAGTWEGEQGWTQRFQAKDETTRTVFVKQPLAISAVSDFQRAQIDPGNLKFTELRDHVKRLRASGYNVAQQEVEVHKKIAFPLVTIVMTLLAVPFGVTIGRSGALYGIGVAIMLSFTYWLLLTFFMAVGAAGVLPAPLAAWAANLLFLAAALYLTLTVRT